MDKHLHIVSFDVPLPANYGGVIDVFYKIVWLHKLNIKIHLHCYTSGREKNTLLNQYCQSVHYYKRVKKWPARFLSTPYIVQSRSDIKLLKTLQQDDFPVLFEGIHCTYLLHKNLLPGRKVFVRLHNVEHRYYHWLGKHEINFFKKIYFIWESRLLKKYEKKLANKAVFFCLSKQDVSFYRSVFKAQNIHFTPAFLPWENTKTQPGKGCFCLYHGNLSINENEKAADWLMNEVFNTLQIPLVIAGRNPSLPLQTLAQSQSHTCMIVNPGDDEMQDLIKKAQINILPSFNNTGIKLKVLNALYNGRHCLVNNAAVKGADIDELCTLAETAATFKAQVATLFQQEITEGELLMRAENLKNVYSNDRNAMQLIAWIY
ncbi:MAG: glycosyltransferase [Ferruginibacter sp.]